MSTRLALPSASFDTSTAPRIANSLAATLAVTASKSSSGGVEILVGGDNDECGIFWHGPTLEIGRLTSHEKRFHI